MDQGLPVPPLIRRARQEQREAGLAGPNTVSKFANTLVDVAASLDARQQVMMRLMQSLLQVQRGHGRISLVLAVAGAVLVATVLGGFVGYRLGRAELGCAQKVYSTPDGTEWIMCPRR